MAPGAHRAASWEFVLAQADYHRQRLAEHEAIRIPVVPPDHPDFGSLATLRYGIGYERHRVQWCQRLASALTPSSFE